MKTNRLILIRGWAAALLLAVALLLPQAAAAYDFKVGSLCYNKNSDGTSVTVTYQNTSTPRYSNLSGNLIIPKTVTYNGITYSVSAIDDYTFGGCTGLTSVTIPASVTKIGTYNYSSTSYQRLPFYNCTSLKKVIIEDGSSTLSLSAGVSSSTANAKGAFADCPLEEVYLGRNISYVESTSITFNQYPERYGYSAFFGQSILTKITIGENVTKILPYLFYNNSSLTLMTLPHVQDIGKMAFKGCSKLTTLNLGDAIVTIGVEAFSSCTSITKLTFPNTTKKIDASAFNGCSKVTEITTGTGLTSIGASAFYGCEKLTAIILPNQFKTMGSSAFENCTRLTIAQLGESITSIPSKAFKNCTSLSEMTIPATAVSIGDQAFYDDSGLATITMNEGLETIGDEVFWNNSGIVRFTIPGTVTTIGKNCFYGCTHVAYLIFSESDQELTINNTKCQSSIIDALTTTNSSYRERYCDYFYDCPIRYLTLGRNLKYSYKDSQSMYDWNGSSFVSVKRASAPFVNNKTLLSVTIGPKATYLYNHLFNGCSELASLTMGPNVVSIYSYACNNCDKLANITAMGSSKVGYIYSYAFNDCDKLESVDFPVTLNTIYDYGFYSCDRLASTTFKETSSRTLTIKQAAFMNCVALTSVTYPGQLISLGQSSYRGCTALHTTIFKNSPFNSAQLIIDDRAFSGCTLLKTVTYPNHLYKINNYVYEKCPGIEELSFPMKLISIGNYVFANSPNLKNIRFENANTGVSLGYGAADESGSTKPELPLFKNSNLASLYMGRNINYSASADYGYSPFYNQTSLTDVKFSQTGTVTYCNDYLLYQVNSCEELLLPESLASIGSYTFASMSKLKGINIPNRVTSMGTYAFAFDKSLKYAKLSTGCSWLKEGVFSGCDSLEYITIPPVVTKMDTKLFANCKSLATVTFEGSPDMLEIGYGASSASAGLFRDCPVITLNLDRWLSYDTESPSHSPFGRISTLKNLNIGENVGVIDKYMFQYCSGLEEVYLPDNIESIGISGFLGCRSLRSVRFSQRLSQISDYGFEHCTSLDNVVFPASMTSIAANSFYNCTSLKKLDLGNNLLIIGPSAFKNCSALEGITIPETLYGLGVEAFANCKSLPNVTIRSITSVGKQAFQNCTGLEWVSLSDKTTSLGENSFDGCTGIKYVKSYAEFPPEGLVNFPESVVSTGTLYVPNNSISYYATSPTWENWFKIQQLITATSVSINKTEVSLIVNETEQLTATILPEDATDKTVIWASSDETISTVNNNGLVTAVAPGTATITATTIDGSNLTANCTITVNPAVIPATSIALNQTTAELNEGETLQLTATVLPENATDRTVTWTSSNTAVAAVDANGLVTAVAAGTVAITATTNDGSNLTANCEVVVSPAILLGDANGDNTVNVTDYVATASYILEQDPQPFVFAAADIDGTGTINVTDLVGVAAIALTYQSAAPRHAPAMGVTNGDITMGGVLNGNEIVVDLSNDIAITALQMDVALPQGLQVAEAALTARGTKSHSVDVALLGNGDYRLLAASSVCKAFAGNEGALLRIKLSDEPSDVVTLHGIQLAAPDASGFEHDDIVLAPVATGLNDANTTTRIYAQNGDIVVETPVDGTVVVALPNGIGMTRKVTAGHNVIKAPASGIVLVKMNGNVAKLKL